jgi:hypothetical protein
MLTHVGNVRECDKSKEARGRTMNLRKDIYMENVTNESRFRDFAEKHVAPQFVEAQTVEVEFFEEGNLIESYCNIEYQAVQYAVEKMNGSLNFTTDEFLHYCKTMVYARINWVINAKPSVHPTEHLMVPSFLMNIIMQIGLVQDPSLGLTITPASVPTSFIPMDRGRMMQISMRLESISGYEGGFGYPRDKSGAWDFMTMTLINNDIKRHDSQAHPVYAIMASVVGPKLVTSVLSPIVTYGSSSMFEGLLWQLTSI